MFRSDTPARELRGRPVVVSQQPAESLVTMNVTQTVADFLPRIDDLVFPPLGISFSVIMEKELGDSVSQ